MCTHFAQTMQRSYWSLLRAEKGFCLQLLELHARERNQSFDLYGLSIYNPTTPAYRRGGAWDHRSCAALLFLVLRLSVAGFGLVRRPKSFFPKQCGHTEGLLRSQLEARVQSRCSAGRAAIFLQIFTQNGFCHMSMCVFVL